MFFDYLFLSECAPLSVAKQRKFHVLFTMCKYALVT